MNRKLLRETYHVEIDEINFTHGLPAWLTEALSGETTSAIHNYTHSYGSHYAATLQGKAGQGVVLSGSPLSTGVVKVLEMEALGITVSGSARLSLGLEALPSARIALETLPADAGVDEAGLAQVQIQGDGGDSVTLFEAGSETVIGDLDLGIVIDCERKRAEAHVGYSWVGVDSDGFPVDQVMRPVLAARLVGDGGNAELQVKRIRIGVYT